VFEVVCGGIGIALLTAQQGVNWWAEPTLRGLFSELVHKKTTAMGSFSMARPERLFRASMHSTLRVALTCVQKGNPAD